jgi:hypothetical protein
MATASQMTASQDVVSIVTPTCQLCMKTVVDKSIKCAGCGEVCHAGCLVSDFNAANGGTQKPGYQWLADFMQAGNFLFACKSCINKGGKPSLVFPAGISAHTHVQQQIEATNLQL